MKKLTNGQRLQHVMSKERTLIGEYTTKSGQTKNRYINRSARFVVKTIVHVK